MKKDIRALSLRVDRLSEQLREDHRLLLLGLSTERDATRRAFQELAQRIDSSQARQYDLMANHAASVEKRFEELGRMLQEAPPEPSLREELDAIKARLDRLENPPAA